MSTREAPIPRTIIDETLPWLRAAFGLCFVAYSAVSTIQIGAADLLTYFEATRQITIGSFADAYWYSTLAAVIFFIGEVVTGERYPKTYRVFLIPDAIYTARQMQTGWAKAFAILAASVVGKGEAADIIGFIASLMISGVLGYLIAKWGEVLLFGKRRRVGRAKKEE